MAVQAQFPLCGSQDWIDNGCGSGLNYYLYLQQQQQQQQNKHQNPLPQQLQYQFKNQNLGFDNSNININNNNNSVVLDSSSPLKNSIANHHPSMSYSQSMAAYEEKQRQEIDHYIRLQNERLRLLLQEQRKQDVTLLMKKIEAKVVPILKQKDEEIAQAAKRRAELEEFMKRLEMENQAWQRVAQENEAMVISLNSTIGQLRERASSCCFDNNNNNNNNNNNGGAEDAESCCDVNREEEQETEQLNRALFIDDNNDGDQKKMMMICKGCNSKNSCILFLPCRHLCSCKACEAFLDTCPVCQTVKKASIEALIV